MSRREIIAYAITHAPKGVKGGPYEGPLVIGRPVPTLAEAWRTHSRETLLWWLHVTRHTVPTARVIRIVRARLAAAGPDPMPVVRAAMEETDAEEAEMVHPSAANAGRRMRAREARRRAVDTYRKAGGK